MGNSVSPEYKSVYRVLVKFLAKKEVTVNEDRLKELLIWASAHAPEATSTNIYQKGVRDKIGVCLWHAATRNDMVASKLLEIRRSVYEALDGAAQEASAQSTPARHGILKQEFPCVFSVDLCYKILHIFRSQQCFILW